MPIIDCHVHLNNYDGIDATVKKSFSLKKRLNSLVQSMDSHNIKYSIILSSYKIDTDRPSTSKIIDATRKYENRLGVVAGYTIDNHTDKDLKECRQWLKNGIIKGIKLYCGYEHHVHILLISV